MLLDNWDELTIASSTKFVPRLLAVKAKEEMWQVIVFSVYIEGLPLASFCPLAISHTQQVQE